MIKIHLPFLLLLRKKMFVITKLDLVIQVFVVIAKNFEKNFVAIYKNEIPKLLITH